MKKTLAVLLSVLFALSGITALASDTLLTSSAVVEKSSSGVTVGSEIKDWTEGGYVGFDVDMTGVKSISLTAKVQIVNWTNGEAFRLRLDDPKKGEMLGYLIVNRDGDGEVYTSTETFGMNLEKAYTGRHRLYLVRNYAQIGYVDVQTIRLSSEPFEDKYTYSPVPDSAIIDNYADTWQATDMLGRHVADYEEVGDVKEGEREVGMFYWQALQGDKRGIIASEAIAEYPEAKTIYEHSVWATPGGSLGSIYWNESVFGFYSGADYWVKRRHAEMLANAGIDAIFFDCTNGDRSFVEHSRLTFAAFQDARRAGVNTPKISYYMPMSSASKDAWRMLKSLYLNCYRSGEFADLWYYRDGKPLLIATQFDGIVSGDRIDAEDTEDVALASEIKNFFNYRYSGTPAVDNDNWHWRDEYPQPYSGAMKRAGRDEFVSVATAINVSYEYGSSGTGAFSDPYVKGRAYTEGFGEDYRPEATAEGYFMKEQISRALELDTTFVFITGWNEWHTSRSATMNDMTNVFIDLFDDENSRDIEPTKGYLKDTFYMLATDFVRKYKGVRPAPVASGAKTIDITAGEAAWAGVGPEFIGTNVNYTRDIYSNKDRHTDEPFHYTASYNNVIVSSKVSFDAENLYFMAKTAEPVKDGANFMQLYINADRNYATGWEGYDYGVNVKAKDTLSNLAAPFPGDTLSTVTTNMSGNLYQVVIPRAAIGEVGTVDLEFKWADATAVDGEILHFYDNGSVAPLGRFNYLYTEVPQTSVPADLRERLSGTSIVRAGSTKMLVSGGKMNVYEADTRVAAFGENGTVYIPARALEDIMGYGQTKVEWANVESDMLIIKNHDLYNDEITDSHWVYTTAGSLEAHKDGRVLYMTNPVKVVDGIPYVPATLLSECFGFTVFPVGDVMVISRYGASEADAASAAAYLG